MTAGSGSWDVVSGREATTAGIGIGDYSLRKDEGEGETADNAAAGKGRGEKHWAVYYGDNRVTVSQRERWLRGHFEWENRWENRLDKEKNRLGGMLFGGELQREVKRMEGQE